MRVTKAEVSLYEKGKMLGFVKLTIDDFMVIDKFKLFKGENGREFDLGLPSESYTNKENKQAWRAIVFVDYKNSEEGRKFMDEARKVAGDAYKAMTTSHSQSNNSSPSQFSYNPDDDDIPF